MSKRLVPSADARVLHEGVPKLFIVGTNDRFAPKAQLERLVAATPPPTTVHWVEGAKHSLEGHEGTVVKLAVEFVLGAWRRSLDGGPTP